MALGVSELTLVPTLLSRPNGLLTVSLQIVVFAGNPTVNVRYGFDASSPLDFCGQTQLWFNNIAIPVGGTTVTHPLLYCASPAGTSGLYELDAMVVQVDPNGNEIEHRDRSGMLQLP